VVVCEGVEALVVKLFVKARAIACGKVVVDL
jgi:hypothetical protein